MNIEQMGTSRAAAAPRGFGTEQPESAPLQEGGSGPQPQCQPPFQGRLTCFCSSFLLCRAAPALPISLVHAPGSEQRCCSQGLGLLFCLLGVGKKNDLLNDQGKEQGRLLGISLRPGS